jgi:hypothetical protein
VFDDVMIGVGLVGCDRAKIAAALLARDQSGGPS